MNSKSVTFNNIVQIKYFDKNVPIKTHVIKYKSIILLLCAILFLTLCIMY